MNDNISTTGDIKQFIKQKTNMITPILDRIIVKPDEAKEKTDTGIYIPDTAKEKPLSGTVVAVGTGIYAIQTGKLIPMTIKAGDKVLHSKYGGTEVPIDGETYLIMKESDIFAVI